MGWCKEVFVVCTSSAFISDPGTRVGVLVTAAHFSLISEGFVKEQWFQEIFEVFPTKC